VFKSGAGDGPTPADVEMTPVASAEIAEDRPSTIGDRHGSEQKVLRREMFTVVFNTFPVRFSNRQTPLSSTSYTL